MLVSLLWKKDWKRQSQLVRKWGEHCTENAEAALAARWLVPLLSRSSNITLIWGFKLCLCRYRGTSRKTDALESYPFSL